jgi:hypothetical protein
MQALLKTQQPHAHKPSIQKHQHPSTPRHGLHLLTQLNVLHFQLLKQQVQQIRTRPTRCDFDVARHNVWYTIPCYNNVPLLSCVIQAPLSVSWLQTQRSAACARYRKSCQECTPQTEQVSLRMQKADSSFHQVVFSIANFAVSRCFAYVLQFEFCPQGVAPAPVGSPPAGGNGASHVILATIATVAAVTMLF